MNIEEFINKIIPPDNYQERNGFNNHHYIDQLNEQERSVVENKLIELLHNQKDTLIIQTLAYLRSKKSLPLIYKILHESTGQTARLVIAASIYEIDKDEEMINIAIDAFRQIENTEKDAYYTFRILPTFYLLKKFSNPKTDLVIKEYVNHSDYLLSYNAKQALNQK